MWLKGTLTRQVVVRISDNHKRKSNKKTPKSINTCTQIKLHKISSQAASMLLVALRNTMRDKSSPKSCRFCNQYNIWVRVSRSEGGGATHW